MDSFGKALEKDLKKLAPADPKGQVDELLTAVKFLQSFVPEWAKVTPKGLDPTFYGTLTYEGDVAVRKRVEEIEALVERIGS